MGAEFHIKFTLDSPETVCVLIWQSAALKENICLNPGSGINDINLIMLPG